MKNTFAIILSGLLLCGCSQKQASSTGPAIDFIQAGKDIIWPGGYVLHVTKRDGNSIEGIQIIRKSAEGQMTITADTGSLTPGSFENTADNSAVLMTLINAKTETVTANGAQARMRTPKFTLVLSK